MAGTTRRQKRPKRRFGLKTASRPKRRSDQNPLSMHLGHAPRCGTVCPHTLPSAVTHGVRRQAPKGGPTLGGSSTMNLPAVSGEASFARTKSTVALVAYQNREVNLTIRGTAAAAGVLFFCRLARHFRLQLGRRLLRLEPNHLQCFPAKWSRMCATLAPSSRRPGRK